MDNQKVAKELLVLARDLTADEDRTEAYERLLKEVSRGQAILTAGEIHPDVPTIHNFSGKYHSTVDHLGFGGFRGHTDSGNFIFDGGGAMIRTGGVSWCPLSADKAVLRDLKYNMSKVKRALKELLAGKTASEKVAVARDLTAGGNTRELARQWAIVDKAIGNFNRWARTQGASRKSQNTIAEAQVNLARAYRHIKKDLELEIESDEDYEARR